jgi:hypothetical protein
MKVWKDAFLVGIVSAVDRGKEGTLRCFIGTYQEVLQDARWLTRAIYNPPQSRLTRDIVLYRDMDAYVGPQDLVHTIDAVIGLYTNRITLLSTSILKTLD